MANINYPNLKKLGNITTAFGGKTRSENFHAGIDIANKNGTPIPNMADGVVSNTKFGDKNAGNQVTVKDGQGNAHMYSHLKDVFVKPGQQVKTNQKIATMGDTGNSYSPSGKDSSHLDYRILNAYNKYVDPSKRIKK